MTKRIIASFFLLILCYTNVCSFAERSYDELQSLFLNVDFDSTYENVKKMIDDTGLPYTEQEYNGSKGLGKEIKICIAYTQGAALQRYADSGDRLDITFQKDSGKLMTMEYVPEHGNTAALVYSFGVWWSFMEDEPDNDYSGYYVNAYTDAKRGGIVIYYNNGNSTKTPYYRYEDKETVLNTVIDGIKQN